MNQRSAAFAKFLEALSKIVLSLDDQQLDALLTGKFRLEVAGQIIRQKTRSRGRETPDYPESKLDEVIIKLRELSSAEDGEQLLISLDKVGLKALARKVHVRLAKQDDIQQMIGKIVRQTISQRISREAIRGTSAISPTAIPVHQDNNSTNIAETPNPHNGE